MTNLFSNLTQDQQRNLAYHRGDRADRVWSTVGGASSQANPAAAQDWNQKHRDALAASNAFVAQAQDQDVKPLEPRLRAELFWMTDAEIEQLDQRGIEQLTKGVKHLPVIKYLLTAGDNFLKGEYAEALSDLWVAGRQVAAALRTRGGSLVGDMAYEGLDLTLEQIKAGTEVGISSGGTRTESKAVWKDKDSKARLEVENPTPDGRPGQIHYHDEKNIKYIYNPETQEFYKEKEPDTKVPRRVNAKLKDKKFLQGIQKALKYLGKK